MAERQLVVRLVGDSRSLERTFTRSARSARGFEHDISRASRGALSAAVSFRGLGRALAFGSFQFLGGAGLGFALKSTIQAAEESQRVLAQTANAVTRSGLSWAKYGKQIQAAALAQSQLSGFDDERLLGTFSNLVRRTGDVTQALKLNALATDVARGRNIDLEAAQALVLKASIGNVGALRRLGINVGKSATAYQALDLLQRKYAGSAAAYGRTASGAQDRFRVAIQNTQEAIGSALLPSITRYLNKGSDWLSQTKNQQRIQRDLTETVTAVGSVLHDTSAAVKTVTGTLGGLRNTLEVLLALKVASTVSGWAGAFSTAGLSADKAALKVAGLKAALSRLVAVGLVTVAVEVVIHRKQVDDTIQSLQDRFTKFQQGGFTNALAKVEAGIANQFPGVHVDWKDLTKSLNGRGGVADQFGSTLRASVAKVAKESHFGVTKPRTIDLTGPLGNLAGIADPRKGITATQRNTFFDNAVARVLLRGGLGDIKAQLGAINQASALISQRIARTKDITRKLNLEDQLLQLGAQAKDLRAQLAQGFLDALQFGVTKAQATANFRDDLVALSALQAGIQTRINAEGRTLELQQQLFDVQQQIVQARRDQAAKRIADLTGKQFRQLGLTATGDEITPGVANLKKRLATVSADVSGSFLDTKKMETQLARFRKVLSEGLVPKDVRAKVKEMLDGIRDELNKGAVNLTKFRHVSSSALLAGLGLSPEQIRELRPRLAAVGAGGTVPGQRSQAFSTDSRDSGPTIITLNLDGKQVERVVAKHRDKREKTRSVPRRGR